MHCLLKSRYFIPPVCLAAFILSHSAAHSFMVLAWATTGAATGASAAALASATTTIKQRLFMSISCAGREGSSRRLSETAGRDLRSGGVGNAFLGEACLRGAMQLLCCRLILAALLGEAGKRGAVQILSGRLYFAAVIGKR